MRITIELPTSMSSKQEEIELLEKLSAKLQEAGTSYMSSLISPKLVEWFKFQVRDDWCCNIAEALEAEKRDAVKAADRAREEVKDEIANLRKELAIAKDCWDKATCKIFNQVKTLRQPGRFSIKNRTVK